MKVLIVEDEQLAVEKLTQTLQLVAPNATVIASADSVSDSVNWLRNNPGKADLILMDIELADGQSFAIFDEVQVDCPVIFTTSYDEYALKAFKVNSIDYLLKPIQQAELKGALNKLRFFKGDDSIADDQTLKIEHLVRELQKQSGMVEYRKRFLVKHLQKLVPIDVETIAYFYSDERVNFFRCYDNKSYIVDYTMDDIEQVVDPKLFFRPNRALIVSVNSVDQIQPYFGNRLALRLKPEYEKEALVSREKVTEFKIWMGK
ncbi:response regulator transcription factor [Mucilaginibacter corticis]|uniref:Response regulator transcription factor n=1 Tax=Mucilaginibacter corticis TaxID=2597670 RepID=A0A556MRN3_9SPHI|nr:LytTR family DNA-binding domain-containing protein [Mucilaginibacter corticis]TSJ42624.1 response regulator transcription factor [Mucilaginibacter corticis]